MYPVVIINFKKPSDVCQAIARFDRPCSFNVRTLGQHVENFFIARKTTQSSVIQQVKCGSDYKENNTTSKQIHTNSECTENSVS